MRVRDANGSELNAEFDVLQDGDHLAVVLESSSGKVAGPNPGRNPHYRPALTLLLKRLRDLEAVLLTALVASSKTVKLPESDRTVLRGPLPLRDVADVEDLRRRLTRGQGSIGQAPGARKDGNNSKRLLLRVDVPGYGIADAERLARDLATGADILAPEVADAITAANEAAGRRGRGQGRLQNSAERDAIEQRAVDLATAHLVGLGYTVKDVGLTKSYDLHATKDGEILYVEVKGTTSPGEQVVLTRKEVEFMTQEHPRTMLIVVRRIDLDRSGSAPVASGGRLEAIHPWLIEPDHLVPISYRYTVP